MKTVRAGIITGYGINAEQELGQAFVRAGAKSDFIHVHDLINNPERMLEFSIIGFPGGFSFGDHLGSGKVLSHLLKKHLAVVMSRYLKDEGRLILGVCNGFQTIAKMGLVPNLTGKQEQESSLLNNVGGSFIDRWVQLRTNPSNNSPWLKGINGLRVPIRHGEGRFIVRDEAVDTALTKQNLPAFYYDGENPNGSHLGIAGITDTTGRVLGMMPHPEAFVHADQDPAFRHGVSSEEITTDGMRLFLNAVHYCRDSI
jgi:phosphoribosylformylglycinamidine (FGAM) synthase-like amidotransferase family enzyme